MALDWKGVNVLSAIRTATLAGVNKTMADAVIHAKRNHDWQNRTGILEGSVKIVRYAHTEGEIVSGLWGSADVVYALTQDLGSVKRNIPARPYLRPAAEAQYPNLAANIRAAL
jgi:hypothetical protein